MKHVSAFIGFAALGGVAVSTPASAMPVTIPGQASQASNVRQIAYFCNEWGHCWHRPSYGDGYFQPHYDGGWGWHRGWGYGRHRWHPGWRSGWHHWRHWHHGWGYWHQWHQWHQW
jgi:hypothetical protein